MQYFFGIVCGYFIGSLPTAYLVVKITKGIDVRSSGSGNVGGYNAFRVTDSKRTGVAVGVIDCLKGTLAAGLAWRFFPADVAMQGAVAFGAVAGHNYSVWLRFKGGRGLATAAGISFVTGLSYAIIWCLSWFVSYRFNRDILKSNLIALSLAPVLLSLAPQVFVERTMIRTSISNGEFLAAGYVATALLLLSHRDAIRDFLKRGKQ